LERDAQGNDITPDLETFIRQGSVRRRKPVPGDESNRDIQDVGMVSDLNMTAEEMGRIKRNHWTVLYEYSDKPSKIVCTGIWILRLKMTGIQQRKGTVQKTYRF